MNNEGFTEGFSTLYMLLVRHLHELRWTYMFHALQLLLLSLEPGLSLTFSHISSTFNNYNEGISRAPFHVKRAQLC